MSRSGSTLSEDHDVVGEQRVARVGRPPSSATARRRRLRVIGVAAAVVPALAHDRVDLEAAIAGERAAQERVLEARRALQDQVPAPPAGGGHKCCGVVLGDDLVAALRESQTV